MSKFKPRVSQPNQRPVFNPRSGGSFGRSGGSSGRVGSIPSVPRVPNTSDLPLSLPNTGYVGGRTPVGGSPIDNYLQKSFADDSNAAKYQSVLNAINNGHTDASQLFAAFLNGGDSAFSDEQHDMFYQYLLNLMSTADKRAYDWSLTQEGRQYNNPTNELARLMGAGVSRDAAIQILSGSAGGSGVGSGGSAMVGPVSPTGISGTQQLNRANFAVNASLQGLQLVGQLMSQGFSAAQSVEQIKALDMQNYMTQQQVQSYQGVNQLTQALQNMLNQGIISQDDFDSWKNANDVQTWLTDHMETNAVKPLFQSGAINAVFGSPFGREMFNNHWQQQNRSRTDGQILDHYIKGLELQNNLLAVQPELISAEITNLGFQDFVLDAQSQAFFQNIDESKARCSLYDKEGHLLNKQIAMAQLQYEYNQAGFPQMKQLKIDQLTYQTKLWSALFNENRTVTLADGTTCSALEANIRGWLQQGSNAFDAAYLMHMYYNANGSFATKYPTIYKLCTLYQNFGVFRDLTEMLNNNHQNALDRQYNLVGEMIPDNFSFF